MSDVGLRSIRTPLSIALIVGVLASLLTLFGWWAFEFDRALFVYAQALVLSLSFTTYRLAIWSQRPPTAMIFRRARRLLLQQGSFFSCCLHVLRRVADYFVLNRFVWKRGVRRWATHWPIMIGCLMAMAIVVPLVMGWVWFETPSDDLHVYHVMLFGQHVRTMPVDGIEAFIAFHGLVWASIPVILGTSVGIWRRLVDRGDRATQTFGHDLVPLLVLMAIAVTGLLMTFSYSFLHGQFHQPLAWVHCLIVVVTLLWIPFGKLIHIPQRALKLAHFVYDRDSEGRAAAECIRCRQPFADQLHVEDLIEVQQQLGYRYELSGAGPEGHYQSVCPRCRRAMLVMTQTKRWAPD